MRRSIWLASLFVLSLAARADTFVATDVPVAIPDGPSGIAESFLWIDVNRAVLDVNITLTITHTFDGDLRLYLEGPDSTVVRLADRIGQSGDGYDGTTFDDEANVPIAQGSPPYRGSFIPDRSLYALDGIGSRGLWTLRVTDNAARDIGTIVAWQLDIQLGQPVSASEPEAVIPSGLALAAAPNPFNATTRIAFNLARPGPVTLTVFDVLGREVGVLARGEYPAGAHEQLFDGARLAAGLYFARLDAAAETKTIRLLLVK